MWNIVSFLPQGHRSVSVGRHFLLQAPRCPCSVRKRFSRDHCCRGSSKPGCRIVESHTRWQLTTWADFQLCLHRLFMSTVCKSSHNVFLDISRSNDGLRISGWIGQLSYLTIFSTSLSVAAFSRRAGSSMLESTWSHGRGVEQKVPQMRRMVELTAHRLAVHEHDWQMCENCHGICRAVLCSCSTVIKLYRLNLSIVDFMYPLYHEPAYFVMCALKSAVDIETYCHIYCITAVFFYFWVLL